MRRVATLEINRRYATDDSLGFANRELKPTATIISSLRDGWKYNRQQTGNYFGLSIV
jgi:hypothetical protein